MSQDEGKKVEQNRINCCLKLRQEILNGFNAVIPSNVEHIVHIISLKVTKLKLYIGILYFFARK